MENANTHIPTNQWAGTILFTGKSLIKWDPLGSSKTEPLTSQEVREESEEKDREDVVVEPVVGSINTNELLESQDFQEALNVICQSVFKQFGASPKYGEWQDLRQEVAENFVFWLRERKREMVILRAVLRSIAKNLCIDEVRRQKALIRSRTEINLDDIEEETLRNSATEDIDSHILFSECRSILSDDERKIFDGYFTEGRTLIEIAKVHNISRQAASNIMSRIIVKLKQLVESGEVSGKSFREAKTSTSAGSERYQGGTDALPRYPSERPEDEMEQMLLKEGLLSEIPPPITDFSSYRNRKPVTVKGKPISETIIEERR